MEEVILVDSKDSQIGVCEKLKAHQNEVASYFNWTHPEKVT